MRACVRARACFFSSYATSGVHLHTLALRLNGMDTSLILKHPSLPQQRTTTHGPNCLFNHAPFNGAFPGPELSIFTPATNHDLWTKQLPYPCFVSPSVAEVVTMSICFTSCVASGVHPVFVSTFSVFNLILLQSHPSSMG